MIQLKYHYICFKNLLEYMSETIFIKVPEEGYYIFRPKALKILHDAEKLLSTIKNASADKKETLPTEEAALKDYYNAIIDYLKWFVSYTSIIFPAGKSFNIDCIASCVFPKQKSLTEHQFKEYIHKSIYLAKEYIEYLIPKITESNFKRFEHTMHDILTDTEWLLSNYEVFYKGRDISIYKTHGSRKSLSVSDIYSAACELFTIETVPDIERLYLRDLKPFVMFQIRQMLEKLGRNLIGFSSIKDDKNDEIKKFTQVAWDFIQKKNGKGIWKIEFPCNLATVLAIHDWANKFVHTTYIYSNYIQFFALKVMGKLLEPPKDYVTIYSGSKYIHNLDYGDIRIHRYNCLKEDFEKYIKDKMPVANVVWFPDVKSVGAYIISL